GGGGVEPGRVGRRRGGAAQVLEGAARDHQHEQVEHGEEAELERYRYRVVIHLLAHLNQTSGGVRRGPPGPGRAYCSTSNMKVVVPTVTWSPGCRWVEETRRPLTLTPLVEPRSTIDHSPDCERRSS